DDMLRVQPARRQHRDYVDILAREKLAHIMVGGNAKFRGDRIGARANGIADREQSGAFDVVAAQQVGMTPGDASTTEQAKSDHPGVSSSFRKARGAVYGSAGRFNGPDRSILTEAVANQGV